jgi:hypothetical protein
MRYFFGFLLAIGLIVLVFVLIFKGFHHTSAPKNQLNLTNYVQTDTAVRYTLDGPITADQKHVGIRITVNNISATIETYHGYGKTVTQTKTYINTQESYANFLRALQLAGYTSGSTDPKKTDERGFCPLGNRYIFEVVNRGEDLQRFWFSSCGQGTFRGKSPLVRTLFRQQVPDYDATVTGLNL